MLSQKHSIMKLAGINNTIYLFLLKILFIYSWETHGEAETQAEGEADPMQGAQCETQSQDLRITTWAKGRCSTSEHLDAPPYSNLKS